jgi:uncharacterized oligopeptide transporter (OPT) family protein
MRLRIGIGLIILWWLPFWALGPYLARLLGYSSSHAAAVATTMIVIIQTIIGILGMFLVGKQVSGLVKGSPKRQVLPKIWHIFRYGVAV